MVRGMVAVIAAMIFSLLQPAVAFMLGLVLALLLNYPNVEHQGERVDAHAKAALMMVSILFAAGVFTGILSDSGMLTAMAQRGADAVHPGIGRARGLPGLLRRGPYPYDPRFGCSLLPGP